MLIELNDIDTPALNGRKASLVQGLALVVIACLVIITTSLFVLLLPRMAEHFAAMPKAAATALVAATTPKS